MKNNLVLFTRSGYSYTESIAILTQYYSNGGAKRAIENFRDYSYRIVILTFFLQVFSRLHYSHTLFTTILPEYYSDRHLKLICQKSGCYSHILLFSHRTRA